VLDTRLGEILAASRNWSALRELALRWQEYDPDNPEVYELLGEACRQLNDGAMASRAFGSLADVARTEPELLQRAGLLLWRSGNGSMAEAPLREAIRVRPDRVNGYRHLAFVLWQEKRYEEAARVLEGALVQKYMTEWYGDVQRVLREELGYVYRSWRQGEPARAAEIGQRALERGVDLKRRDALRVTLAWETDANDVDLHVADPRGFDCFYGATHLESGLELYQDITRGLGPEVTRSEKVQRGTYAIGVSYFNAGPMGVSRGIVIVLRDDGDDEPAVEVVPFRLLPAEGRDVRLVASVKF
jgi:tetratricopeptide (TPR) repeat protein